MNKIPKTLLDLGIIKGFVKWSKTCCKYCGAYQRFNYRFETKLKYMSDDGNWTRVSYRILCKECYKRTLKNETRNNN